MNLVEDLSKAIENWLAAKEGRSIARLARISGSSESTLLRILKKTNKTVELDGVLDLALVVLPKEEALSFLTQYFPSMAKWQDAVLTKGDNSKYDWFDYLENPDYLTIILLADKKEGTTKDDIKNFLGYFGLQKAAELTKKGVIVEKGERFYSPESLLNISNQKTQTNMIKAFCELYSERTSKDPKIAVKFIGWGGVTQSAVEQAYTLSRTYERAMSDLLTDPANKGDVPFFYGHIQNILKDAQQ